MWWYRGVFLLLMNTTYQPFTKTAYVICMFASLLGSVVSLFLFGVIYEKFSTKDV